MTELDDISGIKLSLLKRINPSVHEELLDFCSTLDSEKYPEATIILEGKTKNTLPLVRIYEKLCENKKEKHAKKNLKKAEKIINSMAALRSEVRVRHPAPMRERPAEKLFGSSTRGGLPPTQEAPGRKPSQSVLSERNRIEQKIEKGQALTREEVIKYIEIGYGRHSARVRDPNPIPARESRVEIIMCSDARQPIGNIVYEGNMTVTQIAGNSVESEQPRDLTIVIGHGGYESGCGAVKTAAQLHSKQEKPDDAAIESITIGAIPKEIAGSENPERANAIYQARKAEQNGSRAVAIYFDMETKTVVQVYGESNQLIDRVIDSIHLALAGSGDLANQTAGFAIVAREGRTYPGKTITSSKPNQVFETYFYIDESGEPRLTNKAIGSLRYALGNVPGISSNKAVVVIDPNPEIARMVAKLVEAEVPGAKAIPMEEDWKAKQIRELK